MKKLFFSLILAAFSIGAFAQAPAPGTPLPTAVFYKADRSVFSTSLIPKDKKIMIMFFDATCEHCQRVAADLSKNTKQLQKANIYLITQDEDKSINYFMDNFAKPLKTMKNVSILRDQDRVFIPLFHPKQYPSIYVYGTDKKLIFYTSNDKEVAKLYANLK